MTFPREILDDDNTPEHLAASVNKEDARSNLYEIRRLTGFKWGTLADLAMVTRRTLYNWAQGGPVAEDSKRHLAQVLSVLRYADRGMVREFSRQWRRRNAGHARPRRHSAGA